MAERCDGLGSTLTVWVPSNRSYGAGKPKGMDGWNEIVTENRKGRDAAARNERENVQWCAMFVRRAMREQGWKPMRDKRRAVRCRVSMTFYEPNARRDVPNVYGQNKYALDALTARHKYGAAAIYDDSQRWLDPRVAMEVVVERGRAGIEITVEALEEP